MDIAPRNTGSFTSDNKVWVYADISKQAGRRPVTLHVPAFTKATHYPDGYIRSGVPLGKITSGANAGKYGPFDPEATDGRDEFDGWLWNFADIEDGQLVAVQAIWDGPGTVWPEKLPLGAPDDDLKASVADHGRFKFFSA